ncbi:Uma2 family endonuclease [Streptomyces bambusae]|uniref:Uma2 family endonuclease n=1 Tax=Streptomyces bambusae TaxID=1550616 RepID=A0ABS6Z0I1_9ACTN|nr:Uma2 family endonuclease [Streptomyces bambusae]MBW5481244.1 Uma2 family endonuclease [Streptomyces bambusae]
MDREADVTVSQIERLHSKLSRLEDMFPGYRTELVEGAIVMSPLRPYHNDTVWDVRDSLKGQLPRGWAFISDVAIPFNGDNEFCPDLALIPDAERRKNLSSYPPDLVELAIEVVSPSSVHNDYEVKDRAYARRGIPNYLIFDPYKAHCMTLWNPGPDGYRGRDTIAYGDTVVVETGIGKFTIDTSGLPVDPSVVS